MAERLKAPIWKVGSGKTLVGSNPALSSIFKGIIMIIGTGMPQSLYLDHWAYHVGKCFKNTCYLVGSALESKQWRDIDVRIIMEDSEWEQWFGPTRNGTSCNIKWSAMMAAFSAWGKETTGLPIDFQIHFRSAVKESDWDKPRNPLGIYLYDYGVDE